MNKIISKCHCGTNLVGKQKRHCSTKCKNQLANNKLQSYSQQKQRGRERKLSLLCLHGNKCKKCGYNKNYSALEFHHRDPKDKKFQLDLRKCSNSKWEDLVNEANKCDVLCSNCHAEHHHPTCNLANRATPR